MTLFILCADEEILPKHPLFVCEDLFVKLLLYAVTFLKTNLISAVLYQQDERLAKLFFQVC